MTSSLRTVTFAATCIGVAAGMIRCGGSAATQPGSGCPGTDCSTSTQTDVLTGSSTWTLTSVGTGTSTGAQGWGSGSGGAGPQWCVLGTKGCPCDTTGACASGLKCNSGSKLCCDPSSGSCGIDQAPGFACGNPAIGSGSTTGSAAGAACDDSSTSVVISDCGYPYASSNPLTSVVFNESSVLRAIVPSGGSPAARIRVFYNDEHALTLGVRENQVVSASGTKTTTYNVAQFTSTSTSTSTGTGPGGPHPGGPGGTVGEPQSVLNPTLGDTTTCGPTSGTDPSGRPDWPALFVTDTTGDPNSTAGDWQQGGTPYPPNAVFGTWKSAVRTVDTTKNPLVVTTQPDADPAQNGGNLGAGSDAIPSGVVQEGYTAEVRWDIALLPGHTYRFQVIVHDGDQNKSGGDSGEACVNYCASSAGAPDAGAPPGGGTDAGSSDGGSGGCTADYAVCNSGGECCSGYCTDGTCFEVIR